jgi:polysaccharide export outer membrane protein
VEGITAGEAASAIETRYVEAQILQPAESHASVFIVEYATQGITVNGEVKAPGVYPALGIRMLNDVISAAGGVTAAASSKVIITHKNNSENATTVEYSPEAITPIIPQVQIFPGDTVMVPRAGIIYVLGAVVKAGGYVLDGRRPLTVESAMALAGGGGRAAALKRAQLVRTQSDGKKENVAVRIDLIYKGKSPDMILQDGDILYIPTSRGKLVSEQAISSALGMGTSVAVYRSSYQ